MRFIVTIIVVISLMITPCLAEELADLDNENARVNYSVGYQIGDDFRHQGVKINPEALIKGIQDALSGEKALMTKEEQRATLVNLQRKVNAKKEIGNTQKSEE